jgi:hypothetical protein
MIQTLQTTENTTEKSRRRWRLLWPFYGLLLGVATYTALTLLPSPGLELQRLGLVEELAVSPAVWRLGVALAVTVLYTVLPPLGGAVALVSLWLPLAFLNVGLAGIYAVLALLALPCLGKREGALVLVLIPLALAYPGYALLLPLVPLLAGLLCGRFLGPYTAAVAALALVVLGLVAGQQGVGGVAIGGDREPLMGSEGMTMIAEDMPLMPARLTEKAEFATGLARAIEERDIGNAIAWLYIMMQWWSPVCLGGTALAFVELGPRLVEDHLVGIAVLWAAAAGAMAWLAQMIGRRVSARRVLRVLCVAGIGVAAAAGVALGHALLAGL